MRGLTVDSVLVNRVQTQFVTVGTTDLDTFHYEVIYTKPVSTNQLDTISVYYHGTMSNEGGTSPWGGVHYEDQVLYALGVGFANNYVSATQHWLACYDHPSDKATADFTFLVPNGVSACSNGLLTATTPLSGRPLTAYTWTETNPASTYLLTFAVGPFAKITGNTQSVNGIPYEYYTLPRDTTSSKISYKLIPEMVRQFESLFIPYPFAKVGYVNTQRGAMEHQGMVSFPISVAQRKDTVNSTGAHELAHQWFGDLVSPLDFSHAWLTEAFATYCEQAWAEHLFGYNEYLKKVEQNTLEYINKTSRTEGIHPLYNFSRVAPSSNYPKTIYQKGAVVVAMMRAVCGDSAFYQTLRDYLKKYAYGNATTANMREAFRSAMGPLTDNFFDEWVLGRGYPILKVETIDGFAGTIVYLIQTQHSKYGGFTALPLGVKYVHHITREPIDTMFIMDSDTLSFTTDDMQKTFINVGSSYRSLVEILKPTSVKQDDNNAADVSLQTDDAKNFATVHFPVPGLFSLVVLADSTGRQIYKSLVAVDATHIRIPISGLADGTYFVNISGSGTSKTLPISLVH